MTSTMRSHEIVNSGSAHHTRRDVERSGGGGGGRGTLEVAVALSLLMASMTVTEVTTRIAIVGVVAVIGLFLVARPSGRKTHGGGVPSQPSTNTAAMTVLNDERVGRRAQNLGTRFIGLVVMTVVVGAAVGIALSLAFVVGLNSLSLG
jgi:hypothetical protein